MERIAPDDGGSVRISAQVVNPLPLDSDLNRKPMWAVLAKYLSS